MTATQVLVAAKAANIKGTLVKVFRNGQELREYKLTIDGSVCTWKIRAFAFEHA